MATQTDDQTYNNGNSNGWPNLHQWQLKRMTKPTTMATQTDDQIYNNGNSNGWPNLQQWQLKRMTKPTTMATDDQTYNNGNSNGWPNLHQWQLKLSQTVDQAYNYANSKGIPNIQWQHGGVMTCINGNSNGSHNIQNPNGWPLTIKPTHLGDILMYNNDNSIGSHNVRQWKQHTTMSTQSGVITYNSTVAIQLGVTTYNVTVYSRIVINYTIILEWTTSLDTSSRTLFVRDGQGRMSTSRRTSIYVITSDCYWPSSYVIT